MWFFMLFVVLIIPGTMMGFGLLFKKTPPMEINSVFGYRTARSAKNKETWLFAHQYCGRLWIQTGIFLSIVTIIFMLFQLEQPVKALGNLVAIISLSQCLIMILTIPVVERALKKTFDKNGRRI